MANFETVLTHPDAGIVRIIVTALKAHGFNPREEGTGGLPGMPGVDFGKGYRIEVPPGEAADARLLANALLEEMVK